MDLRQLNALLAIADHGSFSAAADALTTVQSNVSTHVKNLERELGAVVVDRSTGKLTQAGEAVTARARRINSELEAISADVAALSDEVAGAVRVGVIGTTARWLVPELLDHAALRHPRLRLVIVDASTAGLEAQLATGQIDVAVLNLPALGAEVHVRPLFEEDLMLAVRTDDALAKRERLGAAELAGIPLILPLSGTAYRDELDAAVEPAGVTLEPRLEVDGIRLIANLTFEGCGPAVLPASAVPTYLSDRWRLVPLDGVPPRLVGVAHRRRGRPSAPAQAALDMIPEIVFDPTRTPPGLHPVDPERAASVVEDARRRYRIRRR
jgi:DNA-binding transcriptional LysR family regulator